MDIIDELYAVILDRKKNPQTDSYVSTLFSSGERRILEKIEEESLEVIDSAKTGSKEETVHEVADLLFHLLVLLGFKDISPADIEEELKKRRK